MKDQRDLRSSKKYQKLVDYIKEERKKRGLEEKDLHKSCLPEPSGEAYGDGYILVEIQLMHTEESCPSTWGLVAYDKVALDLAFNYAFFGKRG